MQKARVEKRRIRTPAKTRRVAGVQVRSGVKAGRIHDLGGLGGGESRLG